MDDQEYMSIFYWFLLFSFIILSRLIIFCNVKKWWYHQKLRVNDFKELPFYNASIEKPRIKHLKNINLLTELPFYNQLSIIKANQAFRGYVISYKAEIVERKDPVLQLEVNQVLKIYLVIF